MRAGMIIHRERNSKYNNKTSQADGINFHSRKERDYYLILKDDLRLKRIKSFKRQVSFDLYCNGRKICSHIVDFFVESNDGSFEVHEVKGFSTAEWNLKRKLFEANFESIPYKVVR